MARDLDLDLGLTLDPVIRHTVVHHSSTSTYIPNFIEIEETFCGQTDGRTYSPPLILLGRLLEVDLKTPPRTSIKCAFNLNFRCVQSPFCGHVLTTTNISVDFTMQP